MFEPAFTQFIELAAIEGELARLRADRLRAAVLGVPATTGTDDMDAATDRVVAAVRARYRDPAWTGRFPPEIDPDPAVGAGVAAAREAAVASVVLLHRLIAATPIVGVADEPMPGGG
jgi:hypothetical protein